MPLADLTFTEADHTYRKGDRMIPSVTTILRRAEIHIEQNGQVSTPFEFVQSDVLRRAQIFGRHVHLATDLFDRGELDEENLDPLLRPYLDAYKLFLSETGFVVTHSEALVYNARQRYAGRLDKRGTWKCSTWLLDLKSGLVPRTVGPQTSAYQQACEEKPKRRLCLQLMRNRYKLHRCEDSADWSIFLSALNLHNFDNKGIVTHGSSETEAAGSRSAGAEESRAVVDPDAAGRRGIGVQ